MIYPNFAVMKQYISILLSTLLLLSSSGIAYAKHYCGEFEMLSQITLGEENLSCGMVMEETSCDDEQTEEHSCCDNEYTQVTTDNHFAKASFDIQFDQNFVAAFVATFVLNIPIADTITKDLYSVYDPPPIIRDIPVLYETFLI